MKKLDARNTSANFDASTATCFGLCMLALALAPFVRLPKDWGPTIPGVSARLTAQVALTPAFASFCIVYIRCSGRRHTAPILLAIVTAALLFLAAARRS